MTSCKPETLNYKLEILNPKTRVQHTHLQVCRPELGTHNVLTCRPPLAFQATVTRAERPEWRSANEA